MGKGKYYVVWVGDHPGIYDNWQDCQLQVNNYPGARYKSYPNRELALKAYRGDPVEQMAMLRTIASHSNDNKVNYDAFPEIIQDAIAVDAACSKNPGPVEYRGVHVGTGKEIFHVGPLPGGTNNIGEFMALIHALALCEKLGRTNVPIYSDSRTAQAWVRNRKAKTTLTPTPDNARTMEIFRRAEQWISTHTPHNPIIKWDTERWGEIPADFGRK